MTGQRSFASALLDRVSPVPSGLVTWNGSDPAQRFAVYRNNVAVALIDALAATFPVTQALCGEAFFRDMARSHALTSPPVSPLLVHFGQDFPDHIAGYQPARSLSYLADVARLEAARAVVWHAADAVPIAAEHLAQHQATIAEAELVLHPAHRAFASPYAIVSIWAAHNGTGDLADVDTDLGEEVLIVRPSLDTEVWRLPSGGAAFVQHLGKGLSVAEAAMAAHASQPSFDPAIALRVIIAARLIVGISSGAPA